MDTKRDAKLQSVDFVAEFKKRVRKLDVVPDPVLADVKKREQYKPEVDWDQNLYSIYKRSLPVHINYPVLMNLTEEDATRALKRLQTKNHNDPDGGKHAIYYDKVLQSDPRQKSVYWNDKPVTKEDGSDNQKELELLRGSEKFNETWVG